MCVCLGELAERQPCIHSFSFLHAKSASRDGYAQALGLKDEEGAAFVDIGCFCTLPSRGAAD